MRSMNDTPQGIQNENYFSTTMAVAIEDAYEDVVSKAQKGLGIGTDEVAKRAGIEVASVKAARKGEYLPDHAKRLAEVLGLNATALSELAEGELNPEV